MTRLEKDFCFRRMVMPSLAPDSWWEHMRRHWDYDAYRVPRALPADQVRARLDRHMPELVPDYEALLEAAPHHDGNAQLLALYNLPPFFAGCSQSIARRGDRTTLIRNYDVGLNQFAGVFRYEVKPDGGWLIGSAEGGWGYVDGLNHRGLAVSITFGGRFAVGDGFDVPIIVRYLLQTCATVDEAIRRLEAVPHRLAQNYILLDRGGAFAVVYASPDGATVVDRSQLCCTNHQVAVAEPQHAKFTRTVERFEWLAERNGDLDLTQFLEAPLYSRRYSMGFGTLYTVELDPVAGTAEYIWPCGTHLVTSPVCPEIDLTITFDDE